MNTDKEQISLLASVSIGASSVATLPLPAPKVELSFRLATMDDFAWIDSLQKKYDKSLGFFPRAQMQGYIEMGGILVAWASRPSTIEQGSGGTPKPREECVGYIISRDRYLKRDELGVIFQLCVEPGYQRGFIGAALLREVFNRSAYGCRLYGCWCAQDLPANRFWEAMGFVPLAFREGSDKKGPKGRGRVHIYWQKRIDEASITTHQSPYWYPSATNGGAIRADRLVFPIPPGVHWKDVQAVKVEEETAGAETAGAEAVEGTRKRSKALPKNPPPMEAPTKRGPRQFGPPPSKPIVAPVPLPALIVETPEPAPKVVREKKPTVKANPKLIAAARELRDRWLEHVSTHPEAIVADGKYDVARALPGPLRTPAAETGERAVPLLSAA